MSESVCEHSKTCQGCQLAKVPTNTAQVHLVTLLHVAPSLSPPWTNYTKVSYHVQSVLREEKSPLSFSGTTKPPIVNRQWKYKFHQPSHQFIPNHGPTLANFSSTMSASFRLPRKYPMRPYCPTRSQYAVAKKKKKKKKK